MIGPCGMTAGEERVLSRGTATAWAAEGVIDVVAIRISVDLALAAAAVGVSVTFGGDAGPIFALRERYVVHEYGDLVLGR